MNTQEYEDMKKIFSLLKNKAKELKLNDIDEHIDPHSEEPEALGYMSGHPKAKEGWSFEVSIKEVQDYDKDTTGGKNE